jgi:hypothetical protein
MHKSVRMPEFRTEKASPADKTDDACGLPTVKRGGEPVICHESGRNSANRDGSGGGQTGDDVLEEFRGIFGVNRRV